MEMNLQLGALIVLALIVVAYVAYKFNEYRSGKTELFEGSGEFGGSSNLIGTNIVSGGITSCTMHSRDPRCPGIGGTRRK